MVRTGSGSVATCDNSMVLTYGSLAVMLFGIVTGAIFCVALLAIYIFPPESKIPNV